LAHEACAVATDVITRRGALAGVFGAAAASLLLRSADAPASPPGPRGNAGPLFPTPRRPLKRFLDCRYGAFLCWSPATLIGKEFSWSRNVEVPVSIYDNLYKRFDPKEFDADEWIRVVREGGFRYAVFVTKHHDGFAMWNTKTTDYSITHTPFGRDVLREVSLACAKAKFPLCLYYSIPDLYHPDSIGASHANGVYLGPPGYALPRGEKPDYERYVTYMKSQIKELSEDYGPILSWWFDGGWQTQWTYERGVDLLEYVRKLQPDVLTDQRVGCAFDGRVYIPTWFASYPKYVGDYAVLEVDMPRFNRDVPWEYTTPANGRSYCWTPGPYLEPDVWIDNLVKSVCGNGNYLLGLTPAASGRFDPALVDKLRIGNLWLQRYGESIYGTRGGPYKRTNLYGSTCRDDRVYLHIFDPKAIRLTLPPLPLRITGCRMLNGGQAKFSQTSGAVTVEISPNDMESPSTIVVLEVDGPTQDVHPIGDAPLNRGVPVRSSNESSSQDRYAADGDMRTCWTADGKTEKPWLEYDLGGAKTFSRAILFEGEWEGQLANIHHYQIEARSESGWKLAADVTPWGHGSPRERAFDDWPMSVFHPEVRFPPMTARFIRLRIVRATAAPAVHEFELYER
jgi:alpha-L-fucosidase